MKCDRTESKSFSILSWVALAGVLLTAGLLIAGIVWFWSQTVLMTDTSHFPEFQGMSQPARYLHFLSTGFLNATWILAFAGVLFVWIMARGRGAPAKRLALALSLVSVDYWLLLTLVFLMAFSNFKT
jgi:hypothetical protein